MSTPKSNQTTTTNSPKRSPDELIQLIAEAPYLGEFKAIEDLETTHDGLVVYTVDNHPTVLCNCTNNQFVIGFEATGHKNVEIIGGGNTLETISKEEICKNGMPTGTGLYFVAFRVPINRLSIAYQMVYVTGIEKLRCARFMDYRYCEPFTWSEMVVPLYQNMYKIREGLVGLI